MNKVNAYRTHYEITDYDMGDCAALEQSLAIWDDIYYKNDYKCYYNEDKRVLYVPRGYNANKLSYYFDCGINEVRRHTSTRDIKFSMKLMPRNDLQREAIRFLCGVEEYKDTKKSSQVIVSLPTGEGKTYCACAAMSVLGYATIIVVNTEDLKTQWKNALIQYSTLSSKDICDIDSTALVNKLYNGNARELKKHKVYITTHSTIRNIIKNNGGDMFGNFLEKLGIGIKIIDEAHLDFDSTLNIDIYSNVYKTIYLSATFSRSDVREDVVFQRCFEKVFKFCKSNDEKRKHVVYIPFLYNSRPSSAFQAMVKGFKGFDKNRYIDYQLTEANIIGHVNAVMDLFESKELDGITLLLSSKKESCDIFKNKIEELYPHLKVCTHYSGSKVSDLTEYDVICATPKMLGTGSDIKGLRKVINTEPMRSKTNSLQLIGRLREYAPDKDTYYVELVDKGFSSVLSMYNDRRRLFTPIVKSLKIIDTTKRK